MSSPNQKRRVLIVEDHRDTATLLQRLLTSWGFLVTTAASVAAALDTATDDLDVLLCDLHLPDGTGWDLLQRLRQRGPARFCPIAISGHAYPHHIARSQQAGFAIHFAKPFNIAALRQFIEHDCLTPATDA